MSDAVIVSLISTAGLIAVALISQAHRTGKRLKAIDERTERELDHNHGSSIKDDTKGTAIAVGQMQRRLDTFLAVAAVHHPEHAQLYLALRSDHDQTP